MKDKDLKFEEVKSPHTLGSGLSKYTTLLSDTLKPNGHTGTDTRPGVWLHNKPTDLSVCVSEDRGYGEGGVVYVTLLSACTGRLLFIMNR